MMHRTPDPNRLTPVDASKNATESLKGIDVISPSGERLGTISDFLLAGNGQVDAVIVETFGVLGLGARHVSVTIGRLDLLVDPYDKFFLRVELPSGRDASAENAQADTPNAVASGPTAQTGR